MYHIIYKYHFIIYKLNMNLKKDDLSQLKLFLMNYFFLFLVRQIIVKISKKNYDIMSHKLGIQII